MILVFASGFGSNFDAIANAFPDKIAGLVCNKEGAGVLEKAQAKQIPCYLIPHKNFSSRIEHEKKILNAILPLKKVKLIVLAGYMRILSPYFFAEMSKNPFPPLLINLHPAYLDQYKGAHAYEHVVEQKFPYSGLSIHEVTDELDAGPLINSASFPVFPYEKVEELQARARSLEHKILVDTIAPLLEPYDKHTI